MQIALATPMVPSGSYEKFNNKTLPVINAPTSFNGHKSTVVITICWIAEHKRHHISRFRDRLHSK